MGGAGALVVEIVAATVVVVVAGADVDPVRTEAGSLQGNEGAVVEQREMQVRSGGAATLAERGVDGSYSTRRRGEALNCCSRQPKCS